MITYSLLVCSTFLVLIISNDNAKYDIKNEAILCLALGWFSAPFIVCLIFYQEKYVMFIVNKYLRFYVFFSKNFDRKFIIKF